MGLLFSAAEVANLRRQILSTLTQADLLQLNEQLQGALGTVEAEAQAAGAAAGAAQSVADDAAAVAAGAATPSYVDEKVSGLATEAYVIAQLAPYVTASQLAEAIFGLASEAYVDGKFDGTVTDSVTVDGQVLTFANGLLTSVGPEVP